MLPCLLTVLPAAFGRKGPGRPLEGIPRRHAADGDAHFDPQANVCLLTIMTQERRASLHRMLAAWDGYISIALLVDDYAHAVAQGMHVLAYQGRPVPAPERVTLTIIEDQGYRSPANRFPYNMLRNAALRGCEAEYVMAADVDFVPLPARPSQTLRRHLAALEVRAGSPTAVVLAAFEQVELDGQMPKTVLPHAASGQAPALDKVQLQAMVASGEAIGFASNVYEMGHKCDRAANFFSASQPYATQYEFGCEPCLRWSDKSAAPPSLNAGPWHASSPPSAGWAAQQPP